MLFITRLPAQTAAATSMSKLRRACKDQNRSGTLTIARIRSMNERLALVPPLKNFQAIVQRFGAGPPATNFSTSTQPKCKPASFAPVSVRPIFPGLTL
jgi:hypothetical protein